MIFKLQKDFPFLKDFRKQFATTKDTIFVYKNAIYTNGELPPDILIHEAEHIKQQNKFGADLWINKYLTDDKFRLEQELKAYRQQISNIKNRELKNIVRVEAATNLSSSLYGNIIDFKEALKLLG